MIAGRQKLASQSEGRRVGFPVSNDATVFEKGLHAPDGLHGSLRRRPAKVAPPGRLSSSSRLSTTRTEIAASTRTAAAARRDRWARRGSNIASRRPARSPTRISRHRKVADARAPAGATHGKVQSDQQVIKRR